MMNDLDCTHERTELRRRKDSAQRTYFICQCLSCGQPVGTMVKRPSNHKQLTDFDEMAYQAHQDLVQERLEQKRQEYAGRRGEWWGRYLRYLITPEWKARRRRVLERDNYLCQACLKRQATQAHHLTYKHLGNEPLFELVAICTICHDEITRMDRNE